VQHYGGGPIAACDKICTEAVANYTPLAESADSAPATAGESAGEAELLLLAVRSAAQGWGTGRLLLKPLCEREMIHAMFGVF
jgi:hypothetical protein